MGKEERLTWEAARNWGSSLNGMIKVRMIPRQQKYMQFKRFKRRRFRPKLDSLPFVDKWRMRCVSL